MKIITFMNKYVLKHKVEVFCFILLNLVLWLLSMLTPYVTGNYIDNLVDAVGNEYFDVPAASGSISERIIWQTVIVLAFIWTLQLILSYVKNIISAKVNTLIGFAVRYDLVEHIKRLPMQYFTDKDSAYINQRVSVDSSNVTGFVLGNVVGLFTTFLTFSVALVIMFSLNFNIALMMCLLFPVYLLIYLKFRQPLYELGYKLAEESNEFHGLVNKQLSNIELIKQNAWNERTDTELKANFNLLFRTVMKNARLSYVFNNADSLVRYLANIIIFVYSGFQILSGNMSIGQFTMINLYSSMVISSLGVFLGFGRNYRNSLVAYNRILEVHNTKQEKSGTVCIDNIESITIRSLNFSYGNRQIINNLSAEMKKGNIYTIVGENGSGKSTLLGILSGMVQGYNGNIFFNQTNLLDINIYHLRERHLSVVEQEPVLYFETLRENIVPGGGEKVGDHDHVISHWVKRLDLYDLISSLPNGLDYRISENTANLSGGEKQRLAGVRAFVKDASLLIFDEPNSALDKSSLQLLCEILKEIKYNKIIIAVTHEQSIIDASDHVIKLG